MTLAANHVHAQNLAGVSVLIVEDDYFVAKEISGVLRDYGATILGPVPDVARGRALLSQSAPDCALLDVNLKGHFVFELAEELKKRGVPSIFTTGYDSSFMPERLRDTPCLQKPVDTHKLVKLIRLESVPGRQRTE